MRALCNGEGRSAIRQKFTDPGDCHPDPEDFPSRSPSDYVVRFCSPLAKVKKPPSRRENIHVFDSFNLFPTYARRLIDMLYDPFVGGNEIMKTPIGEWGEKLGKLWA